MEHRIHDAFESVRSTEEERARACESVLARMRGRAADVPGAGRPLPGRPRRRPRAAWIAAAACLVLAIAGIAGYSLYFTPTAAIAIDVNPSLELAVNRFDAVVGVRGYNEEGRSIADEVDVRFMNYEDAVEAVLESSGVSALVDEGEEVAITVACGDRAREGAMLAELEHCASSHENTTCHGSEPHALERAHHEGLSVGRWRVCQEIRSLGSDITAEEANDMSMRELNDELEGLMARRETAGGGGAAASAGTAAGGDGAGAVSGAGRGAHHREAGHGAECPRG